MLKKTNYEESIQEKIGLIGSGHMFNNFKKMLTFFGIENKLSSNSREAFYKTLERYCTYKNIENSQKIIILEVFEHKKPNLRDKSLENSPLYLPCFYLLLKYLYREMEKHQDKEYYYLGKTKISEIIGLCKEDYYNNKEEYLEDNNSKSLLYFYLPMIDNYLYKKTDAILQSMKSRGFISFDYVRRVKFKNQDFRDATKNEEKQIEEVTNSVCKQYNVTLKGINLSRNKEKIYADINRFLEYESIRSLKITFDNSLMENIKLLEYNYNLDYSCCKQINEYVINELKQRLYEKALIEKENNKTNVKEEAQENKKSQLTKESLELYIDEFCKKGAPITYKFDKIFELGDEADIRRDIEKMINQLIKIEDYLYF